MRLGIDGYFMCGKRTGMGVVLENILGNWQREAFERPVLFVPPKSLMSKNIVKIYLQISGKSVISKRLL